VDIVASGKHIRLMKRGHWEYAERVGAKGVVAVVAVTDDLRIVLTEQYRAPVQKNVIDLPAGLVGDSPQDQEEAPVRAAARELEEEVGYRAASWTEIGQGPPSPGMSSEIITFFRASGLTKVGQGGGVDEGEHIAVHEIPLANLKLWLSAAQHRGVLVDLKLYAGLYLCG
jgi:ADP-ribose pyrophosphatase